MYVYIYIYIYTYIVVYVFIYLFINLGAAVCRLSSGTVLRVRPIALGYSTCFCALLESDCLKVGIWALWGNYLPRPRKASIWVLSNTTDQIIIFMN